MNVDLAGRRALVTGASSGLGAHFAGVLAHAGVAVACAARRMDALEAVVGTLDGDRSFAVRLDVTDPASVRAAVAVTVERLGGVDILVNNSGIAVTKALLDVSDAEWDDVVATNLSGAWRVAQAVARTMREHGGGSIINIASIAGVRAIGGVAAYAASKAGLLHLTGVMALELARYEIRVNAIAPGYIETEINREFFATEAGAALVRRVPQRRIGQPADLDGALLLLASDASRFMTGSVITVDGGHAVNSL